MVSVKVDNGPQNRTLHFGDVVHGHKYGNIIEMKANPIKSHPVKIWKN